jgi:energy-coupling factor transporter ATP-binding protein EcfA2
MSSIADFQPLEGLAVPGVAELKTSGLTLLVGPNSSGKSQLLKDLYNRLIGEPRRLVVASDIVVAKPGSLEPFMKALEDDGYFSTITDDAGTTQLMPRTTYLGSGQAVSPIQPAQAQGWYSTFKYVRDPEARQRNEFLNYFGRYLVTGLFLDRRLSALGQVGVIDYLTQAPQHDLHALFLNDDAKAKLLDELVASFGKAVWPDSSRGNIVCMKVSDEGVLPSDQDRLSIWRMAEYRSIEDEGDGLKSYVATCVALLLGQRPVCLIDEPEMCLHPPQAYNLGRFIGRYAAQSTNSTIVATHSSHLLRGVIQTAPSVQIVRLTRRATSFVGHLVSADTLKTALSKPTLRAESVLDGIFAQAVVIIEADSDRLVYQAVWETLNTELRLDIHFSPVGGTGGIADTCRLYRTLKIPVAVVADLDLIADKDRLRRVVEAVSGKEDSPLMTQASEILEEIRKLPPTLTPEELCAALKQALASSMVWEDGDDSHLRRELSRLASQLDRMRRLKTGGIGAFPATVSAALTRLVADLKTVGIFVVPVGELEQWLAGQISESKTNKWAWASAAAQHIQDSGSRGGDIWDFMRNVGSYLASNR